ncbi:MAG: P-loop NTPase [Fimbriimonadales bacterium]|nr:P-loop NTPase [Fimbriimonadales bacterium]
MRTIAITSGKGGTGKTTVAINLSLALAEAGSRVVLFDADLQLANVDVAMNLKPERSLQHVVAEEARLRDVLVVGPKGVRVACGGSAIRALMTAGPKRLALFFEQIEELASDTDFLLFDTSAGLDNRVQAFVQRANETLVVTTPDPTSVTDAYAAIKTFLRKEPMAAIAVLPNMVSGDKEGETLHHTVQAITKAFLSRGVDYHGCVRSDPRLAVSARRRTPLLELAPNSPAAQDVRRIAARLAAGTLTRYGLAA